MQKYIRTNDEGNEVLDYDLLDMAARVNFTEDVHRIAREFDVDVLSEPDATNAERAEAVNDVANQFVNDALYQFDIEQVDPDTKNWMVDTIATDLADRYDVEL